MTLGYVRKYGEKTADSIDEKVKSLVAGAFLNAKSILERNRAVLEESSAELLRRETLNEAELQPYFKKMVGNVSRSPAQATVSSIASEQTLALETSI